MNLTVLGDRVFVRPDPVAVSDTGIVIMDNQKVSLTHGTVVAVGEGPELVELAIGRVVRAIHAECDRYIGNEDMDSYVKAVMVALKGRIQEIAEAHSRADHLVLPGDRVLFAPDTGEELRMKADDPLLVMRESDILAVIEEEIA